MKDQPLLKSLKENLASLGIQLFIAEHEHSLTLTISEKIERMILSSHVSLFLLTEHGMRSGFVQQEVGYCHAKKIPSLLIVEKGLEKELGGFNYGRDFLILDKENPRKTISTVEQILLDHWEKACQDHQLLIEQKKKKDIQTALAVVGFVGLFLAIIFDNPVDEIENN